MGDVTDFRNFMGAVIDGNAFRSTATRSKRRRRQGGRSSPRGRDSHDPDTARVPSRHRRHTRSRERARPDRLGGASRAATRAAAAGSVATDHRHAAQQHPADATVEALELKRAAAAPQASVDVGFWGGAIPSSLGSLRAVHDAGVSASKRSSPSGVDEFRTSKQSSSRRAAGAAAVRRVLIVHAEDPAPIERHGSQGGTDYPTSYRAARPRRRRRDRASSRRCAQPAFGPHPAPARRPRAAPDRGGEGRGSAAHGRDLPALPELLAEGIPDGATRFKCCPPIRDTGQPRSSLAGARVEGTIDIVASDHSPATKKS